MKLFKRFIKRIRDRFEWYRIDELRIGGHCGCCGQKVENEILPIDWAITICKKCGEG